jgi:hypothetical protein
MYDSSCETAHRYDQEADDALLAALDAHTVLPQGCWWRHAVLSPRVERNQGRSGRYGLWYTRSRRDMYPRL